MSCVFTCKEVTRRDAARSPRRATPVRTSGGAPDLVVAAAAGDRDRHLLLRPVDGRVALEGGVAGDLDVRRAADRRRVHLVVVVEDLRHALLDRGGVEDLGDEEARRDEPEHADRGEHDHHDRDDDQRELGAARALLAVGQRRVARGARGAAPLLLVAALPLLGRRPAPGLLALLRLGAPLLLLLAAPGLLAG